VRKVAILPSTEYHASALKNRRFNILLSDLVGNKTILCFVKEAA
jgi:hypothetical protein